MNIEFTVPSPAAPQGSKRHVGRGIMVESSKAVAPFRAIARLAAAQAMAAQRQEIESGGPVAIRLTFGFPRPKKHYRANGQLRSDAPHYVVTTPDIDKCVRSTLDALTGVCFRDDKQVVRVKAEKVYTSDGGYVEIHAFSFGDTGFFTVDGSQNDKYPVHREKIEQRAVSGQKNRSWQS